MTRARRPARALGVRTALYHELAPYYDQIYHGKNYRAESTRLRSIVRQFGRSAGRDWLDVACGTGKHLEHLRKYYHCSGVDASPEMLRIARRRLPGVRFTIGDMRSLRLGREFDVVSCLFSAIGHLPTEHDLLRCFRRLALHLKPGGVAIVEPWISPEMFRGGALHLRTYQDPKVLIVRASYSRRRGNVSFTYYDYLVGRSGRGIRHLVEVDRGLMVRPGRLVDLMREAGLRPRYLKDGFMRDRGLLVGTKPPGPNVPLRR